MRILICNFDGIGEVLCSLDGMNELFEHFRYHEIDVLCTTSCKDLIKSKHINNIISYDRQGLLLAPTGIKVTDFIAFIPLWLKTFNKYDLVIDLKRNRIGDLFAKIINAKDSITKKDYNLIAGDIYKTRKEQEIQRIVKFTKDIYPEKINDIAVFPTASIKAKELPQSKWDELLKDKRCDVYVPKGKGKTWKRHNVIEGMNIDKIQQRVKLAKQVYSVDSFAGHFKYNKNQKVKVFMKENIYNYRYQHDEVLYEIF